MLRYRSAFLLGMRFPVKPGMTEGQAENDEKSNRNCQESKPGMTEGQAGNDDKEEGISAVGIRVWVADGVAARGS